MIIFDTNKMNSAANNAYNEYCEQNLSKLTAELDEFFDHCIYTPEKVEHIAQLLSEYSLYANKKYIKKIKENTIV